jgi:hypothetical protein
VIALPNSVILEAFEMSTKTVSTTNRYDPCLFFIHDYDKLFNGPGQIEDNQMGCGGTCCAQSFSRQRVILMTLKFYHDLTVLTHGCGPVIFLVKIYVRRELSCLGLGIISTSPVAAYFENLFQSFTITVRRLELVWLVPRHKSRAKSPPRSQGGLYDQARAQSVASRQFNWRWTFEWIRIQWARAATDIAKLESKGDDRTSLPAEFQLYGTSRRMWPQQVPL